MAECEVRHLFLLCNVAKELRNLFLNLFGSPPSGLSLQLLVHVEGAGTQKKGVAVHSWLHLLDSIEGRNKSKN